MDDAKRDAGKLREIAQAFRRLQEAQGALSEEPFPLPRDAPEGRAARQAAVAALDLAAKNLPLLLECCSRFGFLPCGVPLFSGKTVWVILEEWVARSSLTPGQKMELQGVDELLFMRFHEEEFTGQLERWATALEPVVQYVDLDPGFILGDENGWDKVNRQMEEAGRRLTEATTVEHYQAVGHICREVIISLAQAVYDRDRHGTTDQTIPSTADAKRMIDAYLAVELKGSDHKELRKVAKATYDLAVKLQHDRTGTRAEAQSCLISTKSLVDQIAVIDPRAGQSGLVQ